MPTNSTSLVVSSLVSVLAIAIVTSVGCSRAPSSPTTAVPASAKTLPAYDASRWHYWGGNAGMTRYAPLDQINLSTVSRLKIAWRWTAGEGQRASNYKGTPLLDAGVLYVPWVNHGAAAIDAGTGRTLWTFEPQPANIGGGAPSLHPRSLAFWTDGVEKRVFHNSLDGRLIAIDAKTGTPAAGFGKNGWIDLRDNLDDTRPRTDVRSVSPALVVGDVIVTQVIPGNGRNKEATPGNFRGFDARSGKLLWTFHVVPRAGEFGSETWENDSWKYAGNSGSWSMMSADLELGYVYIPTDTPSNDFSGVERPGNNLFAESILCLDAKTGKRVWHFQTVHHGIWDYDNPSAPILHEVVKDGKRIKAVSQLTKQGFIFTFDRVSGTPVWPIEERPVPQSTIPGEKTSPTQPFPTKPAALMPQGYAEDMLIDFTPELRAAAVKIMDEYTKGPLFTPLVEVKKGMRGTWINPGYGGGANWNGAAFDPETGALYVPLRYKPYGAGLTKGNPATTNMAYVQKGNHVVLGPHKLPILKPPYSEVVAVDMNRAEHLWRIPIGGASDSIRNNPALRGLKLDFDAMGQYDIKPSPVLIKELFFLGESGSLPGATGGPMFRAYDKRDGRVVWEIKLPALVTGAPMTYLHEGRQYLVVAIAAPDKPAELVALTLDGMSANGAAPAEGVPLAAAPRSAAMEVAAIVASKAELTRGKAAYARICATCHGAEGKGAIGPAITGRTDFANIVRVINQGQAEMPPLANSLSEAQIDVIAKHVVKTLVGPPPRRTRPPRQAD